MIAATAAKMVTTLPAGVEGASTAVNVATATTTGLEAANAAVSATEAVQAGAKAAEVGAKAAEVTPDATNAAIQIDTTLAQGVEAPEKAMEDLVGAPGANTGEGVQAVEGKGVETTEDATLAVQKQEKIQRAVQLQMAEWDRSNPPAPGDNIQRWIEQRAAA